MYRTHGVCTSAGRRLVVRANAIPQSMRDREGFTRTPDREPLPAKAQRARNSEIDIQA